MFLRENKNISVLVFCKAWSFCQDDKIIKPALRLFSYYLWNNDLQLATVYNWSLLYNRHSQSLPIISTNAFNINFALRLYLSSSSRKRISDAKKRSYYNNVNSLKCWLCKYDIIMRVIKHIAWFLTTDGIISTTLVTRRSAVIILVDI